MTTGRSLTLYMTNLWGEGEAACGEGLSTALGCGGRGGVQEQEHLRANGFANIPSRYEKS